MNEAKIASKNAFTGNPFRSESNHENSNNKKALFWVFLQIFDLSFLPQVTTYIYLYFSSILWFLQFLHYQLLFFHSKSKIILFLLNSKQFQQNCKHFFDHFKPKHALKWLMKLRLLVKILVMEIILGVKVTVIIVKTKKPCFGYLSIFVTRPLALRVRNTYIYVFRAFFGFFKFQVTFCSFQKLTVKLFSRHSLLS